MKAMIPAQWTLLRHDKWLLSCLTWVPLLLAALIWWIFSQGIARDLPFGVVDLSHSQLSRQLIREVDATATLQVFDHYPSIAEASHALRSSQIYGYMVIPAQFDKSIYRQQQPAVTTFYNSQMILVGKLVNSAVVQAQSTFNAQVEVMKNLTGQSQTTLAAMGRAVPIRTQITPLFNQNNHYAQFLVSAIVPALWQISIVVSTILILAANYRHYGLQKWLADAPLRQLSRTLLPYLPIFLLQGLGFLIWFYDVLDWPMFGHFSILLIAQAFTVMACVIMAGFFYFLTLDPARAMSFAGAFTAPSFAFMGITFPASDMNSLAHLWRSLLPISHYIEVQVNQVSYGLDALTSLQPLSNMWGYLFPLGITLLLIRKHLARATGAAL
ncbi:ABC transporter permease [Vibrio sp. HDW18]|uniref:ABC transporter permease n=1 Tax=Vibrio sp. HDW18 TaxID=2714948 RepID=UPI00140DA233|nr:ABC transporter permease [Vibrio sp. HDW18]QIL86425.1 ABC transporter permease [Vibrio sp. HDW18]